MLFAMVSYPYTSSIMRLFWQLPGTSDSNSWDSHKAYIWLYQLTPNSGFPGFTDNNGLDETIVDVVRSPSFDHHRPQSTPSSLSPVFRKFAWLRSDTQWSVDGSCWCCMGGMPVPEEIYASKLH